VNAVDIQHEQVRPLMDDEPLRLLQAARYIRVSTRRGVTQRREDGGRKILVRREDENPSTLLGNARGVCRRWFVHDAAREARAVRQRRCLALPLAIARFSPNGKHFLRSAREGRRTVGHATRAVGAQ